MQQNHNNLWDNGIHLMMITRQMPTKAGNDRDLHVLNFHKVSYIIVQIFLTTDQLFD